MKEDLVLIYSLEHGQYWKPKSWGYTSDRELAGRYPRAQAKAICEDANKHIPPGERVNEVIEEIDLNKKEDYSDNVSKSKLRKFCLSIKKRMHTADSFGTARAGGANDLAKEILEKFCGGDV